METTIVSNTIQKFDFDWDKVKQWHKRSLKPKFRWVEDVKAKADRIITKELLNWTPVEVALGNNRRIVIHPRLAEAESTEKFILLDSRIAHLKPTDIVLLYDGDKLVWRAKVRDRPPGMKSQPWFRE